MSMSEIEYGNGINAEEDEILDLEWEEWDGKSPFLHHCIAGSIAGVAEHTLLYPVDTVKTHMQAYCSTCPNKAICTGPAGTPNLNTPSLPKHTNPSSQSPHGMWSTMRNLIQQPSSTLLKSTRQNGSLTASASLSVPKAISTPSIAGYTRLWRGVQTMAVGCIPAHALYFSTYERIKSTFSTTTTNPTTGVSHTYLGPVGASIAGAASTFSHDLVMTPLDTIKQRMQLGHYEGMGHAFGQIVQSEGWVGLYRSFGVTLLTNVPYGMVMVSTNEFLRSVLLDWKHTNRADGAAGGNQLDISTTILSGCGAGLAAAAVTAPLDRVKTRLQTQKLGVAMPRAAQSCPKAAAALSKGLQMVKQPEYSGLSDAFGSIVKEEGFVGLWRGLVPRLLTHSPAVAISWTSYEAAKRWLAINFDG